MQRPIGRCKCILSKSGAALRLSLHKGADLFFHVLHFFVEHPGGHAQRAVTKDNDLLHAVRGRHPDAAAFADFVGDPLDEHIGGLGLLGIDHMDVVVLLNGTGAAGHAVGIEHQNEHALLVALIVAQDVHQPMAGSV